MKIIFFLLFAILPFLLITNIPNVESTEIISAGLDDDTRPFDQYTELTTHNAFTNYDDALWIIVNQGTKSIQEQLDEGVRGIMLDAHWFGGSSDARCGFSWAGYISLGTPTDCYGEGVYLCHGDLGCSGFPGIHYALPRQTLSDTMQTIVTFLYQNPDEIVTVFIEDSTSGNQLQDALDDVYGLEYLSFHLTKTTLDSNGWPTKQWLIDNNQRLLIMTDRRDNFLNNDAMTDSTNPVYSDKNILLESEFGYAGNEKCDPRLGTDVTRYANGINMTHPDNLNWFLLVNHFPTSPELITAENDNDYDVLGKKINKHCVPVAGQYPNYIAVDFYYASRDDIDRVLDEAEDDWKDKWEQFNSSPPTATISINNANQGAPSKFVTLSLTFEDDFGIDKCRYSNEDNIWSSWELCKQYKTWILSDGDKEEKTVYYEVRDYFGNTSQVADKIFLDRDLPHQDFNFKIFATGTETKTYDVTLEIDGFDIHDISECGLCGSNGEFYFETQMVIDDKEFGDSKRLPSSGHYSWDKGFHSKSSTILNDEELSVGTTLSLKISGKEGDSSSNDDNLGTSNSIVHHKVDEKVDGKFATKATKYYNARYTIESSPNPIVWKNDENGIASVDYDDKDYLPKYTSSLVAPNDDTQWTQSIDNPAVLCKMNNEVLQCKTSNLDPKGVYVTLSPVDMEITDPANRVISKTVNEIPGAVYREIDLDGDGELDDQIIINDRINGEYKIKIIPEPGADPNDVYSLGVIIEGKAGVLADEVQLKDIPESYIIDSTPQAFNIAPVANISGPYFGFEGYPITLDASNLSFDSDGDIKLYEWDLNNDGIYDLSTTNAVDYTWFDDYDGLINLRVTDDKGLVDEDSTNVTIYNIPPVVNGHSDNEVVLAGHTITFSGSFTDVGALDTHPTIEWDFDKNNQTATMLDASLVYYDMGYYTPTLSVTDDDGGIGIDRLTILVKPITTDIDCNPNTLNLKSNGKWIECHIELLEGHGIKKITDEPELVMTEIKGDLTHLQNQYLENLLQEIDNSLATVDISIMAQASSIEYTVNGYLNEDGNATLSALIKELGNKGNDVELNIIKQIKWRDYSTLIDINTITLNVVVSAINDTKQGFVKNPVLEDTNENGLPELMVKFDRESVQSILEVGDNEIFVYGKVFYNSGFTDFQGIDNIIVK